MATPRSIHNQSHNHHSNKIGRCGSIMENRKRNNTKSTKIVATIGPASNSEEILRALIRTGIDVARINFSHGDHATHGEVIKRIRRISEEEGRVIAILGDLQGPKIRLGKLDPDPVPIKPGDQVVLTIREDPDQSKHHFPLPHPEFVRDVHTGDRLLLDDGEIEMEVRSRNNTDLVCEVIVGQQLKSRKGVSAPQSKLSLSALTEKDREDTEFAIKQDVDYLAMSFVRSADDMRELRWLIRHIGGDVPLIAKIEKHEAIENFDEILEYSDGIMVARGDLGVEIPAAEVPVHQKHIIRSCNAAGKPVITATQMLNSMIVNPRPTRAEASDVANAIFDGTDAVMLSGETASGKYPVEAVQTMVDIAQIAEAHLRESNEVLSWRSQGESGVEGISDAVSHATSTIARDLDAKLIVTSTWTGYTARRVARERPDPPILCVTPNEKTYYRMALVWGVQPLMVHEFHTIDEMIRVVVNAARRETKLVEQGDIMIIIAGVPFGAGGQTNLIKIHQVGDTETFT